jgi:WD40 repeat protein
LAFNRAGDRLVGCSLRGDLHLYEMPSGQVLFQAPAKVPMTRPRFSKDGRLLACETSAERLTIWKVGDGHEDRTLRHEEEKYRTAYLHVAIAPDNRLLAVSLSDGVHFWDLESGQRIGRLPQEKLELPHFVPRAPRGKGEQGPATHALVTGGRPGLLRWPLTVCPKVPGPGATEGVLYRIGPPETLSSMYVLCPGHSGDGKVLVACAGLTLDDCRPFAGGWIFYLDRLESPLHVDKGSNVTNIAVSPDGRWVVTTVRPAGPVKVWDARDGKVVRQLPACAGGLFPRFSTDGRQLTVWGEPGPGGVYSTETWEPTLQYSGRGLLSPDGRLLASETGMGIIQLLDAGTGREVARLEDPNQEAIPYHVFTPDGTRLLTISNGRAGGIHVWDLRAIRAQLKKLGLDWAAPDYPPAQPAAQHPLRLHINTGK